MAETLDHEISSNCVTFALSFARMMPINMCQEFGISLDGRKEFDMSHVSQLWWIIRNYVWWYWCYSGNALLRAWNSVEIVVFVLGGLFHNCDDCPFLSYMEEVSTLFLKRVFLVHGVHCSFVLQDFCGSKWSIILELIIF